jgi:hypothetical protein
MDLFDNCFLSFFFPEVFLTKPLPLHLPCLSHPTTQARTSTDPRTLHHLALKQPPSILPNRNHHIRICPPASHPNEMFLRCSKPRIKLPLWTPLSTISSLITVLLSIPTATIAVCTALLALSFLFFYTLSLYSATLLASWRTPTPAPLSDRTIEKIVASPRAVHSPGECVSGS